MSEPAGTPCPAKDCGRPTTYYLCGTCLQELKGKLQGVGSVIADLNVTIGKRDQVAPNGPRVGGTASNPMPINATAAEVKGRLVEAVQGVYLATKPTRAEFLPATKMALLAGENVRQLGLNPKAPEARTRFLAAYAAAVVAVDLPPERISLGECGNDEEGIICDEELTAVKGDPFAHCGTCGATWDVKERQRHAIMDAWHTRSTLPSVLRALSKAGHVDIPLKRAEQWVMRGKLSPEEGTLYTPAAVLKAYHETPTGKRELKARAA